MVYKKGQAMYELIFVIVILLVFALMGVIAYQVFTDINTDVQADDSVNAEAKQTLSEVHQKFPSTIDNAFITVLALFTIVGMVAAYFADSNPIWLIVIIFLMICIFILAGIFSNTWEEVTGDSTITFETSFPITNWILDNLVIVAIVITTLIGGSMFIKGSF